jgi:hypothetical protein
MPISRRALHASVLCPLIHALHWEEDLPQLSDTIATIPPYAISKKRRKPADFLSWVAMVAMVAMV